MPTAAHGLAFLVAAGAAVITVRTVAAAGAGSGHTGATGSAGGNAGQQRRTIHDTWWGHLGIIPSKPCVDPLHHVQRNDGWNVDLGGSGGIVQATGSRVSAPVRPFAGRVVAASQDVVHGTDAKSCAAARAMAVLIEPFGGFLDAERTRAAITLYVESEDQ